MKTLIESNTSSEKIVQALMAESSRFIRSKDIPRFWWGNMFHRINKSLPVQETTEDGLRESIELIGPGRIEISQGRYTYTDENFFGYTLFVAGELFREGYRYTVVIRGDRGVWVTGGEGGNTGGEIRRFGTNIHTISELIQTFEQEFIK